MTDIGRACSMQVTTGLLLARIRAMLQTGYRCLSEVSVASRAGGTDADRCVTGDLLSLSQSGVTAVTADETGFRGHGDTCYTSGPID
jgi:hypothetical protein